MGRKGMTGWEGRREVYREGKCVGVGVRERGRAHMYMTQWGAVGGREGG